MSTKRSPQARRQRKQVDRTRLAHAAKARQTQRKQALAAREQRSDSARRRRRVTAYVLAALAAALGMVQFLEYTNVIHWMSVSVANLVIGFPAVLLALAAAMTYDS